jgi:Uncharacterised protein family (UPF0014)
VGQSAISVGAAFVVVLAAVAGRLGVSRSVVTAAIRAVAQLAVVSLLITAVLRSWWATAAFVAVMLTVATVTSARRVSTLRLGWAVDQATPANGRRRTPLPPTDPSHRTATPATASEQTGPPVQRILSYDVTRLSR